MTTPPKLEVPEAMRDFADQSVAQARKAFDTFMSNAQSAVGKMEDSASNAQAPVPTCRRTPWPLPRTR
jgi:hypothetical protein